MAIVNYATAKGHMPPSRSEVDIDPDPAVTTLEKLGWVYPILGELEQASLQLEIRNGDLPTEPTPIPVLKCPSQAIFESPDFPLSYVVNGGRANRMSSLLIYANFDWLANGVFVDQAPLPKFARDKGQDKIRIDEIAKYDGTSNTLMLSENPNVHGWLLAPKQHYSQMLWFPEGYQKANLSTPVPSPLDPAYDPLFDATPPALAFGLNRSVRQLTPTQFDSDVRWGRPGSSHPGGFLVALCDGSVRFMRDNVNYGIYAVLMTSRGERANAPGNASFTKTYPWWQNPTAANYYPGTNFD
jgi:hypothetical protein